MWGCGIQSWTTERFHLPLWGTVNAELTGRRKPFAVIIALYGRYMYHKSCISMCSSDYANIGSASWHCFKCNYFTQDSSTFHSYNLSTSNRFSPLLLIPGGMCDGSSMSASSPHMTVRHSSPSALGTDTRVTSVISQQ